MASLNNKAEVYIGYSPELLDRVKDALTQVGIRYEWKEVDHSGRQGSLSDLPRGASMENKKLFTVIVPKTEAQRARTLVGQVLQRAKSEMNQVKKEVE